MVTQDPRLNNLEDTVSEMSHRMAGVEADMSDMNSMENRMAGMEATLIAQHDVLLEILSRITSLEYRTTLMWLTTMWAILVGIFGMIAMFVVIMLSVT